MSASVGFEYEVAGDDDANGEPRADRQGRGDVQLAANDLLTGIVGGFLPAVAARLDQAVVVVGGELCTTAQPHGQARSLAEIPPGIVDAILEAGKTFDISA